MAKYILVYKANEANDWSKLPDTEVKQVMEAWGTWIGSMGTALQGRETFKFGGKSLAKSGVKDADNLLNGFAIIEAKDFDEALEIAQKAPSILSGQGTIEIYEAFAF